VKKESTRTYVLLVNQREKIQKCEFTLRCIARHTKELYEVQGITSTRTPRALSRRETNEASTWSCSAQLPI
jgi:hypothetical protein